MTYKSTAFCIAAINNALALANPQSKKWSIVDKRQQTYLDVYRAALGDLKSLAPYLKGLATGDAAKLNAWFAENGWPGMNVQIQPGGLGIGSVFDLVVDWLVPGLKKPVLLTAGDMPAWYEGVEMTPSTGLASYKIDGYPFPMFELATTQGGWLVSLIEANEPCPDVYLPQKACELLDRQSRQVSYDKVQFPAVGLEADVDISWLKGMHVEDGFSIDEAIKKVRLRLDDKGAHAQSAVALTSRGFSLKTKTYTIMHPFYVIFRREDLEIPPFVALAAPDSWIKRRN